MNDPKELDEGEDGDPWQQQMEELEEQIQVDESPAEGIGTSLDGNEKSESLSVVLCARHRVLACRG